MGENRLRITRELFLNTIFCYHNVYAIFLASDRTHKTACHARGRYAD